MNEVIVHITSNFGNEAIYPVNDNAMTFTKLTGKKTFSRWHIAQIKELGFTITVQPPAL